MPHTWSALTALVLSLGLFGCENPIAVRSDVLRIRTAAQALELTNTSTAAVYYFAAEREGLALIDWAPCTEPSRCAGVAAGASELLAFSRIVAYHPGAREAVVYHWHLVARASGSGYEPDSIRATVVKLR